MSLTNTKYNYNELAKLTQDGFTRAAFPQIRDAITRRMMEIYGNDIDVSSASADGQFINMEALIYDKMYSVLEKLYTNINPFSASGKWLDVLCSFSNIQRIAATRSTCSVVVKNISGAVQSNVESITAIDKNGNEWVWTNPEDFSGQKEVSFAASEVISLEFVCQKYGKVTASGTGEASPDWTKSVNNRGDIYQPIEYGTFDIYQLVDAVPGKEEETDAALRARRFNYGGINTVTILNGLKTTLINNDNIDGAYIIDNKKADGTAMILDDGISLTNHNVYIAIKLKDGITTGDSLKSIIAKIIYNKLTPGVITQHNSLIGQTKIYCGSMQSYDIPLLNNISTTINWKECKPYRLQAKIILTKTSNYNSTTTLPIIKNTIIEYYNSLGVNETANSADLIVKLMDADPKYNGMATFIVNSCTFYGIKLSDGGSSFTVAEYDNDDGFLTENDSIIDLSSLSTTTYYKAYTTSEHTVPYTQYLENTSGQTYQPMNTYIITDTNYISATEVSNTITISVNITPSN